MNLSTLLRIPDIREQFTAEFHKPKIVIDGRLLALPQSKRYSLIGTALNRLLERLPPLELAERQGPLQYSSSMIVPSIKYLYLRH